MIIYIKQLNRLRRMEKSTREKRDLRNISVTNFVRESQRTS